VGGGRLSERADAQNADSAPRTWYTSKKDSPCRLNWSTEDQPLNKQTAGPTHLGSGHECTDPAALTAAKDADVVIAVVGISSRLEGEEMPVDEPASLAGIAQRSICRQLKRSGACSSNCTQTSRSGTTEWQRTHPWAEAIAHPFRPESQTRLTNRKDSDDPTPLL